MSEFRSTSTPKVGRISGNTFQHREVKYAPLGGLAIFEGDIALGSVAQIEAVSRDPAVRNIAQKGIVIKGDQYRWLQGKIPYRIDPSFPKAERVTGGDRALGGQDPDQVHRSHRRNPESIQGPRPLRRPGRMLVLCRTAGGRASHLAGRGLFPRQRHP